jgi:hypothetical protein
VGCPCGHGPDDICLNGLIYGSCGDGNCGGGCTDTGTCQHPPGCCDPAFPDLVSDEPAQRA